MQKLLVILVFLTLVFSCKKEKKEEIVENTSSKSVSFYNTPETAKFDLEVEEILNAWAEFQAFQNSFEVIYRAANNEDLILAVDDVLEKEKALRESTYPEVFDKSQIKSRQKVLRNFLLKVRASLIENTDLELPLKEMLIARNAFRNQFNVIVSNKLDTQLILDEN